MRSVAELVDFIRTHGEDAYPGSTPRLIKELDWFLAKRRIMVIRSRGQIIGLACGIALDSMNNLSWDVWPEDNPDGNRMFIRLIVIHNKVRRMGVLRYMAIKLRQWFPNIDVMVYKRNGKIRVLYVNNLLERESPNARIRLVDKQQEVLV